MEEHEAGALAAFARRGGPVAFIAALPISAEDKELLLEQVVFAKKGRAPKVNPFAAAADEERQVARRKAAAAKRRAAAKKRKAKKDEGS